MSVHASPRGAQHALVVKMWLLTGIVAIADFIFGATFVSFMQAQGLSASVVGALLSITAITSIFFEAPSGAWGDRFGHKRLVVLGLVLWGTGLIVFACSNSAWIFAFAITLWGAGLASYSGAATSLLINTLNSDGLGHQGSSAVRGAEVVRWSAAAAGAVIVGLTAWAMSTALSIIVAGALLILAALWVAIGWPESPRHEQMSMRRNLVAGTRFLAGPRGRPLVVFSILASVDLAIVILTWQPIVLEIVEIPDGMLGFSLLCLTVATALGAAATRWLNRVPREWTLAGTLTLLNLSLVLVGSGSSGAIIGLLGAEFFLGVALATLSIWGQQIFPDTIRATATSLVGTVCGLTIAVTHAGMGALWGGVGLQPAVAVVAWSLAALVVFVAVITWSIRRFRPAKSTFTPGERAR
ncbi:MFS transporter [Microbacterium phyllosphaerae]